MRRPRQSSVSARDVSNNAEYIQAAMGVNNAWTPLASRRAKEPTPMIEYAQARVLGLNSVGYSYTSTGVVPDYNPTRNRIREEDQPATRSNSIPPNNIKEIKRAMIIGVGGVGANLAFSLSKEGYDLMLIDHDSMEAKNLNRFTFTSDELDGAVGKLKTNVVQNILRKRDASAKVESVPQKFEYVIDSSRLQTFMGIGPFIAICCADSKDARKVIEDRMRKATNCKFFLHVGCNLNSISLYPTVDGIIASEASNRGSSYDREPDTSTYLRCSSEVMALITKNNIAVQNDFIRGSQSAAASASVDPQTGRIIGSSSRNSDESLWFNTEYNGGKFVGKRVTVALRLLTMQGKTWFASPGMIQRTTKNIVILSDRSGNVKLLHPDMVTSFRTPHTYSGGSQYQCTGNIQKPRSENDIVRFINEVESSINVVNLDSVSNHYFGEIYINREVMDRDFSTRPYGGNAGINRIL